MEVDTGEGPTQRRPTQTFFIRNKWKGYKKYLIQHAKKSKCCNCFKISSLKCLLGE